LWNSFVNRAAEESNIGGGRQRNCSMLEADSPFVKKLAHAN
jgi:hypothetical protein